MNATSIDSPVTETPPRVILPGWVRLLDGLTTLLLLLLIFVSLTDGLRIRFFDDRITITSEWRILVWLVVLLAVRHAFVRHDPLPRRWLQGLSDVWRSIPFRAAMRVSLVTRLSVLAVGYLAVTIIGFPQALPFRVSDNEFWNLQARWDAGWYLGIAAEGYRYNPRVSAEQNIAFFPAYPMMMRVAGALSGARMISSSLSGYAEESHRLILLAGLLISIAAFTWALTYLYRLAREQTDHDTASAALMLLGSYPFAIYFSAVYTEALFLLSVIGAFYCFHRRRFPSAGAWGLVAGLTRPNGFMLSIPLALLVVRPARPSDGSSGGDRNVLVRWIWPLAAAAMPGVGMLIYSFFIWKLTGRPFAWVEVQAGAWGRTYRGAGIVFAERYEYIAANGLYQYLSSLPIDVMNGIATMFALAMIVPIVRRLGLAYGVFVALNVLPPLAAGGFLSMGRLTSTMFPVFWALALIVSPQARQSWIAAFAVLQGLAAALFFTWRPLY